MPDGARALIRVLPSVGHGAFIALTHDQRGRQVGQKTLADANRASTRPAAAKRLPPPSPSLSDCAIEAGEAARTR